MAKKTFRLRPVEKSKILSLRSTGITLDEIAKKTGRSMSTVVRVLNADDLPTDSPRHYRRVEISPAGVIAAALSAGVGMPDLVAYEVLSVRLGKKSKEEAFDEIARLALPATAVQESTEKKQEVVQ